MAERVFGEGLTPEEQDELLDAAADELARLLRSAAPQVVTRWLASRLTGAELVKLGEVLRDLGERKAAEERAATRPT